MELLVTFLYGGLSFFELILLGRQEELDNKLSIWEYLRTQENRFFDFLWSHITGWSPYTAKYTPKWGEPCIYKQIQVKSQCYDSKDSKVIACRVDSRRV